LNRRQVRKNRYKKNRCSKTTRRAARLFLVLKGIFLATCLAGISLLCILAYDALTQSAYFRARTITVSGNHRLSTSAVLNKAGVRANQNILDLNLKVLRNRLVADPWIADAEIERELPDAVHIRIKERTPVAVVKLNKPFYLSDQAEIFKPLDPGDHPKVPLVTGLRLCDLDLEHPGRCSALQCVMEVIRLTRLHGSVLPFHSVYRIHVDSQMGLTLFCFETATAVKLGFGDYEAKFDRLRDMMAYLRNTDGFAAVRAVDLNDLDRVVVKPEGGVALLGVCYRKEM